MTQASPYPAIIGVLTERLATVLGGRLAGLYLGGSIVTGDFTDGVSDADLVAILTVQPSDVVAELGALHTAVAAEYPDWEGRVEAVYVHRDAMRAFREAPIELAVISPGEPFHVVSGGRDWVLSWYPMRHNGVALFGPPVTELVPEITRAEFRDAVAGHMRGFAARLGDDASPGSQAYAVLTMFRGLHSLREDSDVSKLVAAKWAALYYPQWAPLIQRCLVLRSHQWDAKQADGAETLAEARACVAAIAAEAEALV